MHHPFTSPHDEDFGKLDSEPGDGARQGVRPGAQRQRDRRRQHPYPRRRRCSAGSSRCSTSARRRRSSRFGFFLEALEYGTPPHGGIALGLDRIAALLASESSIREVIAFPKTAAAVDLMSDAPSPVDQKQLRELHLQIERATGTQ